MQYWLCFLICLLLKIDSLSFSFGSGVFHHHELPYCLVLYPSTCIHIIALSPVHLSLIEHPFRSHTQSQIISSIYSLVGQTTFPASVFDVPQGAILSSFPIFGIDFQVRDTVSYFVYPVKCNARSIQGLTVLFLCLNYSFCQIMDINKASTISLVCSILNFTEFLI